MFQSMRRINCDDYRSPLYEIVDDELGSISPIKWEGEYYKVTWVGVVVQTYSKRNFNVVANLVRYFQWCQKLFNYPIMEHINQLKLYQPHILTPEIQKGLEKYMVLI